MPPKAKFTKAEIIEAALNMQFFYVLKFIYFV